MKPNPHPENYLGKANLLAKTPMIFYTKAMEIDRKKPLAGKELQEMIQRDKEAVASSACEGIYFTDEENALFEEMTHRGLSYDEQANHLDEWMHKTYAIPLPDPE